MSFGVRRRARRIDQYTQIDNAFLRDETISIEARGLGAYLLTNNEGFLVSAARLGQVCGTGRDKTRRILKELEDAGYLLREQSRDDGKFAEDEFSMSDEKPRSEPVTEKPSTDNQGLVPAPHKKTIQKTKVEEDQQEPLSGQPDASVEPAPAAPIDNALSIERLDIAFASWYAKYPRKEGKGQARAKYREKRKAGVSELTLDLGVLEYVRRLERDRVAPRYIKLPATWLNGECWDDDDVVRSDSPHAGPGVVHTAKDRAEQADWYSQVPASALLEDQ
jgi:hypothetical protein